MTKKLILKKATRIEGNADIHIEFEGQRLKSARFQVQEFRGFEKLVSGRKAQWVPQMVSRICGLCSVAHQVAGIRAVENAMGIEVEDSIDDLREVLVLGEWISSHALSYFFLTLPDFIGAKGGLFELQESHPEIFAKGFALRQAAMKVLALFGRRATHPVTLGLGRFLCLPTAETVEQAKKIAGTIKSGLREIITEVSARFRPEKAISVPHDLMVNFVAFDGNHDQREFFVFDRRGRLVIRFSVEEFEENIAEMRVDWSLSKIPYIRQLGFPDGIMLVGPLSRSFLDNGFLSDPEIDQFEISDYLKDRSNLTLESYDACRFLEMYWAVKKIEILLNRITTTAPSNQPDWTGTGQGIGVLEAPRGLLIHKYLINSGTVEKARLLVATQFNNAFINLFITDLAQRHSRNGYLTDTGSRLIGRCIRLFDPCLSCATH